MDSIKWKWKNWILYFKKFDNVHHINLIGEKLDVFNQLSSNFLLLLSHSRA